MNIKRILMPTDFSDCAEAALDQAVFWARFYGAELHLLHVVVLHSAAPADLRGHFPELEDLYAGLEQYAGGELSKLLEARETKELTLVTSQVRAIAPSPAILSYAESKDIDLIVLGTHGRRGLRRLLLGSVTEELVRTAGCPVLTVRGSDAGYVEPVRNILVPFDFSPEARWALDQAETLAKACGAQIDLLHVVSRPMPPGAIGGVPLPPPPDTGLMDVVRNDLFDLVAGFSSEVKIVPHVNEGSPAWEICEFAERTSCDLILIAGRGLSGLSRMLLGSVSEKVVRMASLPVMVMRRPDSEGD